MVSEAAQNNIIIDEISFIRTEEIMNAQLQKKLENFTQNITAVFTSMNAVEAVAKFIPSKLCLENFLYRQHNKKNSEKVFGERKYFRYC